MQKDENPQPFLSSTTQPTPNTSSSKKDVNLVCETGLGFSQRDKNVKSQEEKGLLDFVVIRNDGNMDNLKLLTDLKNIIAKQLPKMPKEYIVRLVFDRKHESMVIIKSKSLPFYNSNRHNQEGSWRYLLQTEHNARFH